MEEHRRWIRVLALVDHFAMGGAETMLARFAALAAQRRIDLRVGCLTVRDGNPSAAGLADLGCDPHVIGGPERLGPTLLARTRRYMRSVAPDLVHTHLGSSDIIGGAAGASLGIPVISTIHNPVWRQTLRARSHQWLQAQVRRRNCARIITVSEFARAEYLAQGWADPEQVVMIHNGLDVEACPGEGQRVRAELDIAPEDPVVLMVSALRPEKGHLLALEAFARLRERLPTARLLVAGDGPEAGRIRRRAQTLDGVTLLGARGDVMALLDAAELCLHPSRTDLFPATVIEAMAAGRPVVATRVGGIPEQVCDGRTGVLVDAVDRGEGIAAALDGLLRDPELRSRMGRAARERYENRFTAAPWVAKTRSLYDLVLEGGDGPDV